MRIAITGAGGQLGMELVQYIGKQAGIELIGLTRLELDITNKSMCTQMFAILKPDVIIHCAAYTAVDKAETDEQAAFSVNRDGTYNVAEAAEKIKAKLCYISTDYVFDGRGSEPYSVDAPTHPQTVYGKSKLAGEEAVRDLVEQHFIVRTSWVFGKHGSNFVKTMLRLGSEREAVTVVSDQLGSPTYTYDLAKLLLNLVETDHYGTYHVSNSGICSWYEFAKAVFRYKGLKTEVIPCASSEFLNSAPRPAYSVLSHDSLKASGLPSLRPWQEALQHFLNS
jgi:dTDP-4-dehydrorhamnose reductase